MDQPFLLYLNPNFTQYDPVLESNNGKTQVFYDEGNEQIFIVKKTQSETTNSSDVTVRGPDPQNILSFTLDDAQILSIKFNQSCSILVVQRSVNSVSFFNFANGQPSNEYTYSCKSRSSELLGFCWTNINEIVFITSSSIEFCQVSPVKRQVKCVRSHSLSISWYVYHPKSCLLIVAMGSSSNVIQTLQFSSGTMYKVSKFEVDMGDRSKGKKTLHERDVVMATVYSTLYLLVLKHHESSGSQFLLYSFHKDTQPEVSYILDLELTGRFAVSIIDNLIIVHHQTSKTSLFFDIRSKETRTDGEKNIPHFKAIIPPLPIEPFYLSEGSCEMYSQAWFVFQPNVIIDPTVGCLWKLDIRLEAFCQLMASKPSVLVDFLILRRNAKHHLLRMTRDAIEGKLWSKNGHILGTLSLLFNKFNQALKQAHEKSCTESTTIDQADMFNVFCVLESGNIPEDYGAAVLFEYIHSLTLNEVPIQPMTYQTLINHLVRCRMFYQLQQFVQYHVFNESKPLACLLLSLQNLCSNATQLSLDLFKSPQLAIPHEDMIDVYLSVTSQTAVLRALRFVISTETLDSMSARKFLEVARNTLDERTFFTIFRLFELRNLRTRGESAASFAEGEQCLSFVEEFKTRFSVSSSLSLPSHNRSQS